MTVHEGDAALGLTADDEAADLWRAQPGLVADHILPGSTKDNFWMMGDTGPCGPCTEVHVDLRTDAQRAAVDGATLVNTGDPQVIEIWNLVFIQYNAQADGSLVPLPAKHVDTGMGFERVVAALQGAASNYDTDVFTPLLDAAAALSPRPEVRGYTDIALEDATAQERVRVALRVIADHLRAVSFAIADGVLPANTGRGYVIRRILRRAIRYGYDALGLREPFLVRLVPVLSQHMGEAFPELLAQQGYIERVVRAEEDAFLETLGTGLQVFGLVVPHLQTLAAQAEMPGPDDAALTALRRDTRTMDLLGKAYGAGGSIAPDEVVGRFSQSASEREVPGEVAFLLHDTYGFPLDLTALLAREVSLGVGMAAYDVLMQSQKTRARAAGGFKVDLSMTDDWTPVHGGEASHFVGYDALRADTRVSAVRTVHGADGATRHELVLETTPFYAESGGQVADTGTLEVGGERLQVLDVQRQAGRVLHIVDRLPEELDGPVTAEVNRERRLRIARHHTVTHLLHAGLREVLGTHIAQKGSLVAPERLRFDFSHFERVTPAQLREVERYVNAFIQDNVAKQEERDVPIQDALGRGATALFGEKYGDRVRVITFDAGRSVELCGGTHVGATGEIGIFRFVGEGSVAAGVRRVEALAGLDALESLWRDLDDFTAARVHFRGLSGGLATEVESLVEQNRRLERALDESRLALLQDRLEGLAQRAELVKDVRLAAGRMDGASMDALRELAQRLQQRLGAGSVALLAGTDETGTKALLAVAVAEDLIKRGVQAGKLIGMLAKHVGGGGGGRPNVATAGGRNPEGLAAALDAAPALLADLLG